MDLFTLALNFFLIANPVGNIPSIVALIKDFSFDRQKKIVFREGVFALLIALGFQFAGSQLLTLLEIQTYTVSIAGGIVLLMVALGMIFPKPAVAEEQALQREPFVVPIASPIISGGGVMSSIMIYTELTKNSFLVSSALILAWCAVLPILLLAPYLKRIMGERGLIALEQIMGMVLTLLSMRLVVQGMKIYFTGNT
jgi:multiple antibiotic resistance protein